MALKPLLSIELTSEGEIVSDWLQEAKRRAKEIDEGVVEPIPVEEVRHKAQMLLRSATLHPAAEAEYLETITIMNLKNQA